MRGDATLLDIHSGSVAVARAAIARSTRVTSIALADVLRRRDGSRAHRRVLELPFDEPGFDYVASSFGLILAPDHRQAADEIVRVCRGEARIGLTCWTPEDFVGALSRVVENYVPLPPTAHSPVSWGTREHLWEAFPAATSIDIRFRPCRFRAPSVARWLEEKRHPSASPFGRAFGALGSRLQDSLALDLEEVVREFNTATDGSLLVDSRYVEALIDLRRSGSSEARPIP